MKKAIVLIVSACVAGGIYYYVQKSKYDNSLSRRYQALAVYGKIKRGRKKYAQVGR